MTSKRIRAIILIVLGVALLVTGYSVFIQPKVSKPYLKGKVIFLAGDSRSSTDYNFYKNILEKKTGCTVLLGGVSGCTVAYNASNDYFSWVNQPQDFSIWLVGGNDDGRKGTVGTFSAESELKKLEEPVVEETDLNEDYNGNTFIQAVDHMMRKYKMFSDGRRMVFCTDLPQQRDSQNSEWSKKENWERKRLAILECCEKNGVECLDLYTLCNFDMSKEPMFHEPVDKINDRGVYYMDGLHPNPKGIDVITDFEIEKMTSMLTE